MPFTRSAGVLIACTLSLVPTFSAVGQVPDAVEVQRVAISAAVARAPFGVVSTPQIAVDPLFAHDTTAPAFTGRVGRDAAEQNLLVRLLGARSASSREVLVCKERHCVMTGADVLLTLTRPVFSGTDATVTTTLTMVEANGRFYYETMKWVLHHVGNVWQIVGGTQLGVT